MSIEREPLVALAAKWSAELDRCLRSSDPAVQIQGILSIAPGIKRWGETPLPEDPKHRRQDAASAPHISSGNSKNKRSSCQQQGRGSANFGAAGGSSQEASGATDALLDEELALANSLALRLADTFKNATSAPAVRLAILKLLLLHLQGQTAPLPSPPPWPREGVPPPPTFPHPPQLPAELQLLGLTLRSDSHLNSTVHANRVHSVAPEEDSSSPPCPGFFSRRRLLSWEEFLRRILEVAGEGDPVSRALVLRAVGCVAPLAADDVAAQGMVLESLGCAEPEVVRLR